MPKDRMTMHVRVGALLGVALAFACGDAATDDPTALCGWSEPHRVFEHDFRDGDLNFAPVADVHSYWYDLAGELYFSSAAGKYTSGYCGEDLAPTRAFDGLWHLHEGLALDCKAGVVLRGDSDATLAPVFEGVACEWLETPEGILGWTRRVEDGVGGSIVPLRLLDFRAPELPVVALSDEPTWTLSGYVGPRDSSGVRGRDQLQTGHFASPYLILTKTGTVLHVDRDTWTVTTVMKDVLTFAPSPDGRAFAYRPRRVTDETEDLHVRVLASGEDFTVASAAELTRGSAEAPWWSVDGSLFALSLTVAGQHRDRVLSLATGAMADAPALAHVQRELPDGALWLTGKDGDRSLEYYWEPFADVLRPLYEHATGPGRYRRAAADGVELIELPESAPFAINRRGTLMLLPWDGAQPRVLAADIYPWYRRTADGRVLTTRPVGSNYDPGEPMNLVIIEGDDERILDRSVITLGSQGAPDDGDEVAYFHVAGDLLVYGVDDREAADRSGVWAVNLSRL